MIWIEGQILPDDAVTVSVRDRTLDHGLGLFETLRTWSGEPTLLDRHRDRMRRSAEILGLPLAIENFPTSAEVRSLGLADGHVGDFVARITLSGGFEGRSRLWMQTRPLPDPVRGGGAIIDGYWGVDIDDPLARHKTLNYWRKHLAAEQARAIGADESLSRSRDGSLWEGCRSNLFLVFGRTITTPPLDGPVLPGILRQVVLERAERRGFEVRQTPLTIGACKIAGEAFLTNSVRGVQPVGRIRSRNFDAPGPTTRGIQDDLQLWLHRGGTD